jgi:AcrB/AcrD/AcrF family
MASVSISEPFIRRPVGTTLLAIGLFLVGLVAYEFLPVASVPNVDFPSIRVFASRPGAHRWSGGSARSRASTRSRRRVRWDRPISS